MRAPWLEPHSEFEGVGAHELNSRYTPVDEVDAGYTVQDTDPLLMHTPALIAARVNAFATLATPRLDGPDIAHYQWDAGALNLATTRKACDWFAHKCTQSVKYVDPTYARARAQAYTLAFRAQGYYHWLSSTTDPEQQAAWFLANVGALRPGEFAMLDDEESGVTVAKTLAWLEYVEARTKRPCAVYTGAYVTGGTIWQNTRIREGRYGPRPMILAAYTTEAKARALPGVAAYPWSSWQWGSSGPVPGIPGRCDMNRVDDWAVYDLASARATAPKPNPPTPTPTEDDMPAIVTNADAFTDSSGQFGPAGVQYEPEFVKWEYVNGCKVHIGFEYWLGIGSPQGTPRPYAEIQAVPDVPASPAAGVPVTLQVSGTFTGTAK